MTKISVIIPARNEEGYLPRLFACLTEQTFRDFEVIVADGGSTDNTLKICHLFGAKIVNGGLPGPGRNAGAKIAKGEILVFFDADVLFDKDFLEKMQVEFTAKKLEIATCYLDPVNRTLYSRFTHGLANVFYTAIALVFPTAPGFCIIVTKVLHEKIGGFDPEVKILEDHEYTKRAAKSGKFGFIKSVRIRPSDRRMRRDGWIVTSGRTVLLIFYSFFFGFPKKSVFNYHFHDDYTKKHD